MKSIRRTCPYSKDVNLNNLTVANELKALAEFIKESEYEVAKISVEFGVGNGQCVSATNYVFTAYFDESHNKTTMF